MDEQEKPRRMIITIAAHDRIDAHGAFAHEFIDRIFDVSGALLTDLTSLNDFAEFPRNDHVRRAVCERVYDVYGVNCGPFEHVVDVLDRIKARK